MCKCKMCFVFENMNLKFESSYLGEAITKSMVVHLIFSNMFTIKPTTT